ncbi:sulfotransferase [Candidatus Thiodictyon syntrophicum]|jgi:sulfotransferase|uniref:Sulfotransferase family protein n=1 Tax=Candidatus Thiodictyon syntrophicum TaxID=1166950 RepID=A0A2K8UDQ3_9GAMM|nr:sulfotransferase [Candidatus Thiodictyon syntrophicum]AUB83728.1 hypothetical protein THSYN_24080 [Candidatus Thiodictyon syntrophicum]
MTAPKTVYLLAGLPRSGSTLLANILAQTPRFHVTPTSGILDMLVQVRNAWDRNDSLRAMDRAQSLRAKEDVLRAMLQGWFARVEQPVCLDKNRYWAEFLEMATTLVGGRDRVRVLMTVRDLRDILASFERLYRSTSSLGQVPLEGNNLVKSKTALGRLEMWIDDAQPVGRAYNAVRDAVTRGWKDCLHFVEYDALTREPAVVLAGIYRFLGEAPHDHDFQQVEQVTFEDDLEYGFRDLHPIRARVAPQPPQWPRVYDDAVSQSGPWRTVESVAQFWKLYQEPGRGLPAALGRPAGSA